MSRKYKIKDQSKPYFVTLTVVQWVDVFIRDEYRNIFMESLRFCMQNKGWKCTLIHLLGTSAASLNTCTSEGGMFHKLG